MLRRLNGGPLFLLSGHPMKLPRFASVTLALDTEKHRQLRPEVRKEHVAYLLDRLLCGESVADSEFEHLGIRVTAREATGAEVIR